ncbi:MAG: glycosyl transferase family 51 [Actinomycetales bacterium]|nr:glycosyl transferase family 51 [Actinomycetales bacterium]
MSMHQPPGRRPGPLGILARLGGVIAAACVGGLLLAAMLLPFVGSAGVVTRDVVQNFENLPEALSTPPLPQRSLILASDGSVLATVYYQNRVEVPLDNISPLMRQATVAIEDSRFLDHHGVDLRGIARSFATNVESGGIAQGSSTLTMQYVKNVLVNQATTADELAAARGDSAARKLREVRFALGLEKIFTKGEILERYLNIAYFGAGAYGVEAAARRYFSKPAADLDLVEAATLAGIVQQPTAFDPLRNPDLSTVRRNVVLKRMAELGYITQDRADRAALVPMSQILNPSVTTNGCTSSYAPYFCDYVIQSIRQDPTFGNTPEEREAFLRRGGYTIRTTLDPKAQKGAYDTVNSYIPKRDNSHRAAAISMVEPGTGHVIAMAQNRDWGTKGKGKTTYNYNVDRAMGGTIGMQAGSTFKIFTLAAALEDGISPFEYIPSYSPKTFTEFTNCTTGKKFAPVTVRNSTTSGTLDMARATAYSTNTYFMTIEESTGICRPAEIAESMGVRLGNGDPLLRVPTLTLGTMEVTPLAMANAYATFAAHGIYCKPVVILDVRDRDGNALPAPDGDCTRVLKRDVADTVTVMLNGVVDGNIPGRTGQAMTLANRQAAGKTGTTNESAAVWFAGYTPQLAAAVWVGDPRGGFAHPMKNVTIKGQYYGQVYGGTLPGPIWRDSMEIALQGTEPTPFDVRTKYGLSTQDPYSGPTYTSTPTKSAAPEPPTFDNSDPAISGNAPAGGDTGGNAPAGGGNTSGGGDTFGPTTP